MKWKITCTASLKFVHIKKRPLWLSRKTDARQRGLLGPGTSTGPCLTASNHEILMIPSCDETCSSVDLEIRDVGSPELLAEPCLIPLVCSLAILLNSEVWILSTSCLKHPRATHTFDLRGCCLPLLHYYSTSEHSADVMNYSASSDYTPTHPQPTGSEL